MTDTDRVPLVTEREELPPADRHHYDDIEASRGGVRGPFPALLNSPALAGRLAHLGAYVRFEGELAGDVRELAILTTAREFDCAFEWAAHVPIARDAGVPRAAIDALADGDASGGLSEPHATVVAYGRELLGDHRVSDETFDRAVGRFEASGVTELTATMGYYAMVACVLNAFEVLPDERPAWLA